MSKNVNPYNEKSNYGKLFAIWKKKQVMTFAGMVEALMGMGLAEKASKASATVMISPRKDADSCRGDFRGNMSAKGHLYYADVLKHKAGEDKRFRLRYRKEALEPRNRQAKEETKQVKVKAKAKTATKAKAKSKASAKA